MYCPICRVYNCIHVLQGMGGIGNQLGLSMGAQQMQSQAACYDAIAGMQCVQSNVVEKEQEQQKQRKKLLLLRK